MLLRLRKMRGWWKRRKFAPISSASSKTSGRGVRATSTRSTLSPKDPRPVTLGCPTLRLGRQAPRALWPPLSPSQASKASPCLVQFPAVTSTRIAEILSAVTRLPLLAVPLFLLVGVTTAGWGGLLWSLLCLLLTSGLSLAYLVHLTRSGEVRDPGKILQGERVRPLWVVAALHTGAWALV